MIRNLVILIAFGMVNAIWGSEPVTVQVISAVYEKSITHEFDAKVKKLGLPVFKKLENGRHVVTVGHFTPEQSAIETLKDARKIVAKDAFIRPVDRKDSTAVKTKAKEEIHKEETHAVATGHKEEHGVAAVEASVPVKTSTPVTVAVAPVVVAAAPAVVPASSETKAESKTSVPMVVLECDKKEMRKDEIAEAIAFYKTSPYHRFQPVGLQR